MPYFPELPLEVKRKLLGYFKNKPIGTELNYGQAIELDAGHSYVLANPYIKLEKDIYALAQGKEAVIGEGTFGKVIHTRALSTGAVLVMKIIPFIFSDKALDEIGNELNILYDLGLYRDAGTCYLGSDSKQYIVMIDAGMALDKYLHLHPKLSPEARLDLAIKLCWLVHKLHQGVSSRTLTTYAHRDLKPANLTLSPTGTMRLIDVGIASAKPDSLPEQFAGAPAYLPNIMTFLNDKITLRQLDVFALKRCLYMPNKMLCHLGYKEDKTAKHFGLPMLLSKETVAHYKIASVVDTAARGTKGIVAKHQYEGSPLIMASLLILARYGLLEAYGPKMHNPILACAVIGLYFANQSSSDELVTGNIANAIIAYVLSRVVRRYEGLAEQVRLLALLVSLGITNELMLRT